MPVSSASPSSGPAAPPVELVNVQVDGIWMQFPKGLRMIEALRRAGVAVPHYCYHPKLSSPGNCRMCLVEMGMPARPAPGQTEVPKDADGHVPIQWIPRPAISCANTVSEGMGIRTQSPMVEECRKGVMEFLLINHPLDCPICDQAGECRLQEFSVEHGRGGSRFRERKVKKPKNQEVGPRVTLDDERCIMCSRCVRFTAEIVDDPVLGFTDRGSHTVLTCHPDRPLENNYSLNTVDICPVGALTSTDFRFSMRVWFLRETDSICTGCARGCNTVVGSRSDIIHRLTPRQNDEVNSTWMCDRGRLDFHWINSELRLTQPVVRDESGRHRPATWKQALEDFALAVAPLRGGKIAIVASGRQTNEELFLTRRLAEALSTPHVDLVPRTGEGDRYLSHPDKNPNTNGARLILGLEEPGSRLAGIREKLASGEIRGVIALGENLLGDAGFSADDLAKADAVIVMHPLANPSADHARIVLPSASWAEKRGSMINATGRLQRLNRAIAPPGEARDDQEILRDLIAAAGGGNGMHSVDDVFRALAAAVPQFAGLTLAGIGDTGVPVLETGETVPLLERERERIANGIIVG